MEPITLIYLALIIVAIIIIVKVVKFIIKVIGFIIICVVIYLFLNGGGEFLNQYSNLEEMFAEASIETIKEDLCKDDESSIKCECVVTPVSQDLTERLSVEDIKALSNDKSAVMKEIKISLVNRKDEIRNCLVELKGKEYMADFEDFIKRNSGELPK